MCTHPWRASKLLGTPRYQTAATILAASFASVLPDLIEAPYFLFGIKSKFLKWWLGTQKAIQNDTNIKLGLATQLITSYCRNLLGFFLKITY